MSTAEVPAVADPLTIPAQGALQIAPQVSTLPSVGEEARPVIEGATVPWHIWCSVAAVTSAMMGGYWDISWHMSIGRDTFWTPAHMLIYLCGVLAGISCGWLILSTTLGGAKNVAAGLPRQSEGRHEASSTADAAVTVWGFRGPLGAFIAAWGGVAMLASGPFDNWWHNAYGLDVKIFSPPHVVLQAGILAVDLGALILILGAMNRAQGPLRRKLDWLFLYMGGMVVTLLAIGSEEFTARLFLHSARCYRVVSMVIPIALVGIAKASRRRWASTLAVAFYMAPRLAQLWILPLFPAEPKLGPVYQRVTHFVPMEFPLLLIVPAIVLDVLWTRMAGWKKWLQAVVAGSAFLASFMAVEWPFADFLNSPGARNWFFGAHYFEFFAPPTSYYVRHLFFPVERSLQQFWMGMAIALVVAIVSTRLGLAWGDWMRRIRR